MKNITIRIVDYILRETKKIRSQINKPRHKYINEAINYYNRLQKRQLLEKKLKHESNLVKTDSMVVLKEFENILSNDF